MNTSPLFVRFFVISFFVENMGYSVCYKFDYFGVSEVC